MPFFHFRRRRRTPQTPEAPAGITPFKVAPTLFIKGALCYHCLGNISELVPPMCDECKSITYCSMECKLDDYSSKTDEHRSICSHLKARNVTRQQCKPRTWSEYHCETLKDLDQELPREIRGKQAKKLFLQFVRFRPYCISCHRTAYELPENSTLALCPDCQIVHFCSTCHHATSLHAPNCINLQSVRGCEKYAIERFLLYGRARWIDGREMTRPRQQYMELSQLETMFEYYMVMASNFHITNEVNTNLIPLKVRQPRPNFSRYKWMIHSETVSYILTILAALEKAIPDLATRENIEIHVINATRTDIGELACTDILLHLLPALKSLTMIFLGTATVDQATRAIPFTQGCEGCRNAGRNIYPLFYRVEYHNYKFEYKPDLAVEFKVQPTPHDTMTRLINAKFPTVFIGSDRKQMLKEVELFRRYGAVFLVTGETNRWRSRRPFMMPRIDDENGVIYRNQYWWMISGKGREGGDSSWRVSWRLINWKND